MKTTNFEDMTPKEKAEATVKLMAKRKKKREQDMLAYHAQSNARAGHYKRSER